MVWNIRNSVPKQTQEVTKETLGGVKPIFYQKQHLHWLLNARKKGDIYNMKLT